MVKGEHTIWGKIIIALIILIVPFVIILGINPVSNYFGICTEDICFDLQATIPNKCLDDQDICVYQEDSDTRPIKFSETQFFWTISGVDVVCDAKDVSICKDSIIFKKSDWTREERTINDKTVHIFRQM